MNPGLEHLYPYPFERLNALLDGVAPANDPFISLALGEPKHAAAPFLLAAATDPEAVARGLATYPPTAGLPSLRTAIADFIGRRFGAPIDPDSEVLPVNGTREALFAVAQAINPGTGSLTLMPNPFYQIYEGAAILSGSEPRYLPCDAANGFEPDFDAISDETWRETSLLYICTPGNPHGAVMTTEKLCHLIGLAREHDFVIVSDECYSEIYADATAPPPGLLSAAMSLGDGYGNCLAFNSLSKRSNLPGLRSGYVAGDRALMEKFRLYRTYHGSAMSVHNQLISEAAWNDEAHVIENRQLYRDKYDAFLSVIGDTWPMTAPTASFYLWPETPFADEQFAAELMRVANIKTLPGSYLSRTVDGHNPGARRVRLALVATQDECVAAAERIRDRFSLLRG